MVFNMWREKNLNMKAFRTTCRLLRSLKGFYVKPRTLVGFSTSSYSCGQKKKNPYEEADQAKYSRLVRSVLSSRGPAQTPESLFKEDDLLYGPVSKQKPPEPEEIRVARNWFPIFNPQRSVKPNASVTSSPLKIPLQRHSIPSVTQILQQTMTTEQIFFLDRWKQRMMQELGEQGFAEYTSNIFLQGKQFHEALESILSHQGNLKERDEHLLKCGYIESVQHILKDISGVQALESAVQHETLKYVGLLDCVAEYQGKLCVIDWKTSEKPKPFIRNTYDNPLQVVAYIGAMNHDSNYGFQVQCGLIVVAYKDGSPAHPHFMDAELCSQYWAKWLLRLEEYTEKEKNQDIQKTD
ncbi:mitochondrial genome maintenance exonuclease 1 [Nannospalax galili]|uniref:mitochondrial genome maintenance exonuclease 1 n=1 Tax=Nannospalax galili TaxID=1026970 RepID=UPI0004ED02A6|nr:mitochondrial genome maintenance exonuclease 1 [Nannospalax galili]